MAAIAAATHPTTMTAQRDDHAGVAVPESGHDPSTGFRLDRRRCRGHDVGLGLGLALELTLGSALTLGLALGLGSALVLSLGLGVAEAD